MFDSKHIGLQSPKVPRTPKKIFNVNDGMPFPYFRDIQLKASGNKENVFSENFSNPTQELQRMKSEFEKMKTQLTNEAAKNKKLTLTMQTEMEKSKVCPFFVSN